MIAKFLFSAAVAGFAMSVIFSSPTAALAAAVLGVCSLVAKGMDV